MSNSETKFRWFLIGFTFKLFNGMSGNGTHYSAIPLNDIQSNNIDNKDLEILKGWAKAGYIEKAGIKEQNIEMFGVLSISVLGDMTNEEFYGVGGECG